MLGKRPEFLRLLFTIINPKTTHMENLEESREI